MVTLQLLHYYSSGIFSKSTPRGPENKIVGNVPQKRIWLFWPMPFSKPLQTESLCRILRKPINGCDHWTTDTHKYKHHQNVSYHYHMVIWIAHFSHGHSLISERRRSVPHTSSNRTEHGKGIWLKASDAKGLSRTDMERPH